MQLLADKGVKLIALGWTSFILENVVVSHNRDYIIQHLGGENRYRQVYSGLSTLAMSSIAYGYLKHARSQGPKLPFGPRIYLAIAFQGLGLIGFSQCLPGAQVPINMSGEIVCPFDFKAGKGQEIYGVQRVTRHDKLWSLAFLGLGSALGTPFAGEFVMFAMPLAFALIGGMHQDYRYRRGMGGNLTPEVDNKTSAVPFLALLQGHQSFYTLGEEMKLNNVLIALIMTAGLYNRRLRRLAKLGIKV